MVEDVFEMLCKVVMVDELIGNDLGIGKLIYVKMGCYGDYVQLGDFEVDDKGKFKLDGKLKMVSLWFDMICDILMVDEVLMLFFFLKDIGQYFEIGDLIMVQDGFYGFYVKFGKENCLFENYVQMQMLIVEQVVVILVQFKCGCCVVVVMKEFGQYLEIEFLFVVKNGCFGLYVIDGVVNVLVFKG